MNQLINVARAKRICWFIALAFLVIHVALAIIFAVGGALPLVYLNIASAVFYVAEIFVIAKGWFQVYIVSAFLEVVLNMSVTIVLTGWGNGFQVTLVGLCILAFFSEYMSRSMRLRYVPALPLCCLAFAAYLSTYIVSIIIDPVIPLPQVATVVLQVALGIITFGISIVCLLIFTLLSFNSEKLLADQVTTDELTGLYNRYFVSDSIAGFRKEGGWIAMLDIDDFKRVNDNYGHNFGDEVLRGLASLMKKVEDSVPCRWGGEEFLFLGSAENKDKIISDIEKFRKSVEEHEFEYEGKTLRITVTIGVSFYDRGRSPADWIADADKKLYSGKRNGKNKVVV